MGQVEGSWWVAGGWVWGGGSHGNNRRPPWGVATGHGLILYRSSSPWCPGGSSEDRATRDLVQQSADEGLVSSGLNSAVVYQQAVERALWKHSGRKKMIEKK